MPIVLILFSLATLSCQSKTTSFDSFNSPQWKAETTNCKGYRGTVIENMETEFDKFIGLSERELIEILGAPTKTHLYTRGQKFFSYQINCLDSTNSKSLRIRFSALDYVNEVLILE
ncbi:hypothetical protein N7E81_18225 [Reichenbachiella carrageenanivorans]|uniref:SmpA / OmlA family protein n=1 Tax=Reichenbachiella carrageenanivorans TaxID=2979869 RepID=A0ABY6D2G5_9BACT|nr:hypothetical protein [Reichenbachiella carrageenanivorans]UXX79293.1 hypothetical protein N7E81_18225 [Reichenbachiella carrageenanivorans]